MENKKPGVGVGPMKTIKKIFTTHHLFVFVLMLKVLNAVFELIGGVAVLFLSKEAVYRVVEFLARNELAEDPGDLIANYFVHLAQGLSASFQLFISIYLIIHGIIKLSLVYNLLKKKLLAYPIAIAVFSLFIVYQVYAYLITPSISLILLTVLDIFIIILTSIEYKNIKKNYARQN